MVLGRLPRQRGGNCPQQDRRQIATDGTQKLPQRLVAPIAARLERGLPIDRLAIAVAAWMRYTAGVAPPNVPGAGVRYTVEDPLAATLARLQEGLSPEGRYRALIGFEPVFGAALARNPAFTQPVRAAYLDLWREEAVAVARAAACGS